MLSRASRLASRQTRAMTVGQRTPLRPFVLERFPGWTDGCDSLSSSECEPLSLAELLEHADADGRRVWEGLSLGYVDPSEGSLYLRDEIAAGYAAVGAAGVNVCAPQEGIFLAVSALCAPGDHVVA